MKPSTLLGAMLGIAVAIFGLSMNAFAVDRHRNASSGLWTVSSDWSPNGTPAPADNVFVDFFAGGLGGSVGINTAVPAVTSLTVVNGGTVTMYDSRSETMGSILVGTDFVLGKNSTGGTLNVLRPSSMVAPGAVTVVSNLRLGSLSGAGYVNQNTGTVTIGEDLFIGDDKLPGSEFKAFGRYNISGGTLRVGSTIWVGYDDDSVGELNISGSANVVTDVIVVGRNDAGAHRGFGTVTQTGGRLTTDYLSVGYQYPYPGNSNPSVGTYHLNGGSVTADHTTVWQSARLNYNGGFASLGDLTLLADSAADGARVSLSSGGQKVLHVNSVAVQTGAVVDLNDNDMTVQSATSAGLRTYIARGYNGGAWNGDGITSTAARLHPQHLTALGYAPQSFEWLVKYTWYGDANLDGKVDGADYAAIDTGFNSQIAQGNIGDWFRGDFNYDGKISGADYALIDSAFNAQNAVLRPVPEPGSPLLFAGLAASAASRQRRRRRRANP